MVGSVAGGSATEWVWAGSRSSGRAGCQEIGVHVQRRDIVGGEVKREQGMGRAPSHRPAPRSSGRRRNGDKEEKRHEACQVSDFDFRFTRREA